jgi:hypothetical protein
MANMDHVGKVVGGVFGTILECMHGAWTMCGGKFGFTLRGLVTSKRLWVMMHGLLYTLIQEAKYHGQFKSHNLIHHPLIYHAFLTSDNHPKISNHTLAHIMLSSLLVLQCSIYVIP